MEINLLEAIWSGLGAVAMVVVTVLTRHYLNDKLAVKVDNLISDLVDATIERQIERHGKSVNLPEFLPDVVQEVIARLHEVAPAWLQKTGYGREYLEEMVRGWVKRKIA